MSAKDMWEIYSHAKQIEASYDAWAFGDDPDQLAQLTLNGIKTATASLHFWYERDHLDLPKEGEYSVVLDQNEQAVCIIRTTKVYTLPFCLVSASHAYKEGEGDRSLEYWREVHENFFRAELAETGHAFNNEMEVVCEEFIRVYP